MKSMSTLIAVAIVFSVFQRMHADGHIRYVDLVRNTLSNRYLTLNGSTIVAALSLNSASKFTKKC